MLNWIDTLFFGVRRILAAGVELPERPALNFVGAGVAVTDDPANNRTQVAIAGASLGPDPSFNSVTVAQRLRVGSSGALVEGWPSEVGEIGILSDGRVGVRTAPFLQASALATESDLPNVRTYAKLVADSDDMEGLAETPITEWVLSTQTVITVAVIPCDSLTVNDTNRALITISCRTGTTGAFVHTVAALRTAMNPGSVQYRSGHWTAFRPISFYPVSMSLPAGHYLTIKVEKEGTGISLPRFLLFVRYYRADGVPEE